MFWHTSTPASAQTKPASCFVFPIPSFPGGVFLRLDELDAREAVAVGGEGAKKACRTNSAHERLMQPEQLPSIVSLQISARLVLPLHAWLGKEARGYGVEMQQNGTSGRNYQDVHRTNRRGLGSVSAAWSRGGCAFGLWSNNKPWDCSDLDCSAHMDKKECPALVRGGKEIREGGEGALSSVMNG